jgi:hypothetical protein
MALPSHLFKIKKSNPPYPPDQRFVLGNGYFFLRQQFLLPLEVTALYIKNYTTKELENKEIKVV